MRGDSELLYPRSRRDGAAEKKQRAEAAYLSRPYRVSFRVNYGRGTILFDEYFHTELMARFHAWLHSVRSRPEFTTVIIFNNRKLSRNEEER